MTLYKSGFLIQMFKWRGLHTYQLQSFTHSAQIPLNSTIIICKIMPPLKRTPPKSHTQNYPPQAKSLGATIKNKRRLASSFLVVCKLGWKRTLLYYIRDEKAARIIKDIFMPVSCMANFIYTCVVCVLEQCTLLRCGWAKCKALDEQTCGDALSSNTGWSTILWDSFSPA